MKNLYMLLIISIFLPSMQLVAQTGSTKTLIANLPPEQVRTMAEWEEVEALVIAWESDEEILYQIIKHAIKECKVYILTDDPLSVHSNFITHGIFGSAIDNIEYIPYNANSVWIRDYGPWAVYHNNVGALAISDFLYNRFHRTADDLVPYQIAEYMDVPLYNADENPFQWVHTGGNLLRDGMGTAYSSDLILSENSGKTGLEIENYASRFFGINDYRILHRLPYDTIHHLDMHIRTLDEETLAVGWYPDGVADGPQIETNLDFIRQYFRTPFGNPYHIIRQQMPPRFGNYPPQGHYRTYTNGIFINKTFLVPIYEEQYDSTALNIYREYLPGYNVVGIDCNSIIPRLGALHCITKLVGVKNPLLINHPRLRDRYYQIEDHPVDAWVQHTSGINTVFLHYRLANEIAYDSLQMIQDINDADHWQASIPTQIEETEIQYYISAYANNGKRQVRPLPAPEGYYNFKIKAFEQSPQTKWLQSLPIVAPEMSIQFTDDSQNGVTDLVWSFPGGEPATSTAKNVFVQYSEAGNYDVQLIAENPIGQDTLIIENAVQVKATYTPFTEDFETGIPHEWEAEGEPVWHIWENDECHHNALQIHHQYSLDDLTRSYFQTGLNLNNLVSTALTFDVAHALRDSSYFDELRINLTDQHGEIHNIYNKGGHILATVSELAADFQPVNCHQWRSETIDLREWEGQQVLLEFESIGDQGNSIYIDNISLRGGVIPSAQITQPADGVFYLGDGQPIFDTIQVAASDPDGEIEKVSFYVNNQYLGEDSIPPYEYIYTLPTHDQYCYQAKAKDNEGLQVWAQQVCVRYDQSTANENLTGVDFNYRISPNPATDFLFLHINTPKSTPNVWASILDMNGKLIQQQSIDFHEGTFQYPFSMKNLVAGSYFLQLQLMDETVVLPFVKI